jgi:predicted MPP superfamily phosphohydrolase
MPRPRCSRYELFSAHRRFGTALTFAASFIYSLLEPYRLVVRRFDVAFDDLPEDCDGLRIAQLSDLHCSAITPPKILRRAIEVCNEQGADVVVLTGDYISRRDSYSRFSGARTGARPVMDYAEAAAREIKHLRAPEGVYAVPGNHDHTNGSFEAIELMLRHANITPLVNASTRLRDVLPLVASMTCAPASSTCPRHCMAWQPMKRK